MLVAAVALDVTAVVVAMAVVASGEVAVAAAVAAMITVAAVIATMAVMAATVADAMANSNLIFFLLWLFDNRINCL